MAEKITKPRGLKAAGTRLWASMVAEMAENGCVPDAREVAALEHASRLADEAAEMRKALEGAELLVPGQRGTLVVNPLVEQARQNGLAIERLLRTVQLAPPQPMTPRQRSAQNASRARWQSERWSA